MATAREFRGCDDFYIAPVTSDTKDGYTVGEPIWLCPVQEISKTSESSSETHYYDNTGMITIAAAGSDTITFTVPALDLPTLAKITGATYDETTGAYISGGTDQSPEYAVGYRLGYTDGTSRYVWRLKGKFTKVPDETSHTVDDSITTNNQQIEYVGSNTVYGFSNGGRKNAVTVYDGDGKLDYAKWFEQVVTPDNIGTLTPSNP